MAIMRVRDALGLGPTWPPRDQRDTWEEVEMLAALRDSRHEMIAALAASAGMSGTHASYLTLPLPRLIARAKANLLYGHQPEVTAESDADQANLDRIVEENGLGRELRRAASIASSEGEVWGKVTIAPDVLDCPIIEFVSRGRVIPRFVGRFAVGATFVSEYREGETGDRVYRQLETHTAGQVETRLFLGTSSRLGDQVGLDARSETAALAMTDGRTSVVQTGIPYPLCVFIPNALDADPCRGVTDYLGVVLSFLALNEDATIGQANARLVGRKRLFVEGKYLDAAGRLPADNDVFRSDNVISEGGKDGGPINVAQYTFESAALVEWMNFLVDLTMIMAGVAPQSVGRDVQGGGAHSGTALRLKMSHSLMEAAGTGELFDDGVRRLLRMAQLLDARWFLRRYATPDTLPAVERGDGLPVDVVEDSQVITALRGAEAMSRETAIGVAHPEWSDDQVQAELDRIDSEVAAAAPVPPRSTIPTAPPSPALGAPAPPTPQPSGGTR
jgi:hypothetical protein